MKFSYTLLKRLLPELLAAKKLAVELNTHSFEVEEVQGDMLDIKIPSNQYSAMASHIGVAREANAIFGLRFKDPVKEIVNVPEGKGLVSVQVEAKELCSRYTARVFDLPAKLPPSPAWLKKVLTTCGMKPISPIVDLMNYVMIETGQPMHAFDYESVADLRGLNADRRGRDKKNQKTKNSNEARRIIVRRARKGEEITTLDGQKMTLSPEMLVIADSAQALAIAGIKGGANSGILWNTRRIIVEAANFNPKSVFDTARAIQLRTDAAVMFEHGISPALVERGMNRATVMLKAMGAKLVDSAEHYPKRAGEGRIEFDPLQYEHLIGAPVLVTDAQEIFEALGFGVELKSKKNASGVQRLRAKESVILTVHVPAWRNDIEGPEDLAEEVVRILGYDTLAPVPPVLSVRAPSESLGTIIRDKVRAVLTDIGLDEVYNSSFLGANDLKNQTSYVPIFGREAKLLEPANSMAEGKDVLRPSLVPLLVQNVMDNARYFETVRIFETGAIFGAVRGATVERLMLGMAIATKKQPRVIWELKGAIAELLRTLGIGEFEFVELSDQCSRVESEGHTLGHLKLLELPKQWYAAAGEWDLEMLERLAEDHREYRPLSKYPAIIRDMSLLVGDEARIGDLVRVMEETGPAILESVELTDEYTNEKLGTKQSLTFRLVFQAADRTLSDEEVNRAMCEIQKELKTQFEAEVR